MCLLESLEARRMFAVTAAAFHNTLYVWGDNNNNGISVEKSGSDLVVKHYVSGSGYLELFRKVDSYVNTIRIYGYDGADTITVNDNVTKPTHIMGGRGADWIKGGGGTNTIWGHGNWEDDPSGSHRPSTDDGAGDTLIGGKGFNIMYGQNGNDTLFAAMSGFVGPSEADIMHGGDGNDTFYNNGTGYAHCFGSNGNDTFKAGKQEATFYGDGGTDTVDFTNFGEGIYARPDGTTLSGARLGIRNLKIQSTVETIIGTPFADYFSGTDAANKFYGRAGNDTMYGHGGNDLLFGESGDDKIYGGSGNDTIYGHDGNDSLYGDAGNDNIYGGNGNDLIRGGDGNDNLYGQAGSDWIYGDAGSDKLVGGTGADYLHSKDGVFGNDKIYGDNEDGSGGGGGWIDVAYVDKGGFWPWWDYYTGVESVTW